MNESDILSANQRELKKTVLIIEDQADLRRALTLRLEHSGMRVLSEQDGSAGIASFRKERPDAVLLDLRLPDQDGLSLLTEMRQVAGMLDTPVLIMTGNSGSQLESEAREHGATRVFRKPLVTADIVECLKESLAA